MNWEFWTVLIVCGYIIMVWVTRVVIKILGTFEYSSDQEGAEIGAPLIWPILMVFGLVIGFYRSADAIANRIKDSRKELS